MIYLSRMLHEIVSQSLISDLRMFGLESFSFEFIRVEAGLKLGDVLFDVIRAICRHLGEELRQCIQLSIMNIAFPRSTFNSMFLLP